jgi:hypothetical protein
VRELLSFSTPWRDLAQQRLIKNRKDFIVTVLAMIKMGRLPDVHATMEFVRHYPQAILDAIRAIHDRRSAKTPAPIMRP